MAIADTRKMIGVGVPPETAKVIDEIVESVAGSATVTSAEITDATAVGRSVLTAEDAPTARTAIGAGTSNLALGTTASTALAGNTAIPAASSTLPAALGTAAIGVGTTFARADHVHTLPTIPALSSTAPAALAAAAAVGVGTTSARADHVHAIPGVSVGAVRGTVLIQAAIPNAAAAPTQAEFNAVLAALRAAGVISP